METQIDHLVLAASSREAGMEYVAELLGVTPQLGGKHARMGTHNALLKLDERTYLEVIAIDPEAVDPPRNRWFELDNSTLTEPRLITWVVRTHDIFKTETQACAGNIEAMSRGDLKWLINIPSDGQLIMNGAVPMLIQWLGDQHPCDSLHDSGCRLVALEIRHPEASEIKRILERIDLPSPLVRCYVDEVPRLTAKIDTPNGLREL
jgi:hypothetical protein